MRMVLDDSERALVAAASLGQREKRCCAFFDVAIDIGPDRRTLSLRVPAGAEEAMATFVALLTCAHTVKGAARRDRCRGRRWPSATVAARAARRARAAAARRPRGGRRRPRSRCAVHRGRRSGRTRRSRGTCRAGRRTRHLVGHAAHVVGDGDDGVGARRPRAALIVAAAGLGIGVEPVPALHLERVGAQAGPRRHGPGVGADAVALGEDAAAPPARRSTSVPRSTGSPAGSPPGTSGAAA